MTDPERQRSVAHVHEDEPDAGAQVPAANVAIAGMQVVTVDANTPAVNVVTA
ncbi:hypothetical protein [Paraburkholderia sp. 2C]